MQQFILCLDLLTHLLIHYSLLSECHTVQFMRSENVHLDTALDIKTHFMILHMYATARKK